MLTAIASAKFGLSTGSSQFARAADRTVQAASLGEGDATDAVADMMSSRLQVQASARVMKAADRTLGTLLDLLA